MSLRAPRRVARAGALACLALATGCATLSQVVALRSVEFSLDRVSDATLAGVPLAGKETMGDLSVLEMGRLLTAVSVHQVPLVMTVHVRGENPASNRVTARLVQLDWTLLLDDRETVSGRMTREVLFPPGQPTDVPLSIELDLWDFFGGRAEDLFALARAATGAGGRMNIALRATPTIQTEAGPIRYPTPITIVQQDIGTP